MKESVACDGIQSIVSVVGEDLERLFQGSDGCCIDGCIFVVVVIPKVMAEDDAGRDGNSDP